MNERTLHISNSKVTLKYGDVTESAAQVIVSSDDHYLTMTGGVSAAILRAGGEKIAAEAAEKTPADLGDVVVTSAGKLRSSYVFHVVTSRRDTDKLLYADILKAGMTRAFELLDALDLESIAFPILGTGENKFPMPETAVIMAETLVSILTVKEKNYQVSVYFFDKKGRVRPMDYIAFIEALVKESPQ